MDFDAKQAARSKHKHSQHLKRVHGGRGRGGRGAGAATQHMHAPDLETNYDRYELSDEEIELTQGELVRQSEGADLEQLLAESEQFYAQAHFRYRSYVDTIDTEPPPVDVAAFEKDLAIDPDLLIQALSRVSLSELLGIDPVYLLASDPANDMPPIAAAATATTPLLEQPARQQPAALQPSAQQQPAVEQQSSSVMPQHVAASQTRVAPTVAAAAASSAQQAPKHLPTSTAADSEDEFLQQLLTGSSTTKPAAKAPSIHRSSNATHSLSNSKATMFQPPAPVPAGIGPAVTARSGAPSTTQPAAATGGEDDELDELLGLCGAAPKMQQAQQSVDNSMSAGTKSSKKQSLEDWLDGF